MNQTIGTVERERERERESYSLFKQEERILNKVDITEKSYIIRRYNRHY